MTKKKDSKLFRQSLLKFAEIKKKKKKVFIKLFLSRRVIICENF